METTLKKTIALKESTPVSTITQKEPIRSRPFYSLSAQAAQFESARFGWMAILITIQSCVGAVACMFISMHSSHILSLSACAAVTMGSNALFIALAPPKICMLGFYISLFTNCILLFLNLG